MSEGDGPRWRLPKLFGRDADAQARLEEVEASLHRLADEGRRLAIYDRLTGLYAHWYLQLRIDEEVARASRYDKRLACLVLWANGGADIDPLAAALKTAVRDSDFPAHAGNGQFVVMLPETTRDGADIVFGRLARAAGDIFSGVVIAYPEDGATFDELMFRARKGDAVRAAEALSRTGS